MKVRVEKIEPNRLLEAYLIREKVFVDEQNVPKEEEIDDYESISHHYLAFGKDGKAVGTARWRRTKNGIKLERFAVLSNYRKNGVGSKLLETVLRDAKRERVNKSEQIYLHSQIEAMPLYDKFNFKKTGNKFDECGIMHFKMIYQG